MLKPKHSGFFGTPLELFLTSLHVHRLILTGIATDSCVLSTAADAYMRNYELVVPSDCVAAIEAHGHLHALNHIQTMLKGAITPSLEIRLA